MAPSLVPVQPVTRYGIAEESANGYLSSANSELHGAGHMGVGPLDRIIMSLNSGIESEIEYALSTLSYYLCNEPKLLNFVTYPLMGNELIKYFIKPYHLINEQRTAELTLSMVSLSVESLLSLRNAAQDLQNQQWLCQIKSFRKYAVEALKFLTGWFYTTQQGKNYHLSEFNELFRESLNHLLDVLDPLTCFYVDNAKSDPLFHQLLILLANTSDKNVLIVTIKCLHHLLFLGGVNAIAPKNTDEATPEANNVIDAIQPEHLLIILRNLFVKDDETTYYALQFVKQYLFSEALHPQYPSVKASQLHRLRKLVDANTLKRNLHILMKQLPELIVAKLPLVDPLKIHQTIPVRLARRSTYSGVPTTTAKLPEKSYNIIIAFPEPLRATTWLRCCYEPYTSVSKTGEEATDLTAGEVTQISLWKAYENQFEAIWKDRLNPSWPNLLPAVDFIKNVSSAFPNSEAMVVNMPSADPLQPARKKFIIKGIQPRQFPVSIELGNFEALRRIPASYEDKLTTTQSVGEVDEVAFDNALDAYNASILSASDGLTGPEDTNAPWYSPINALSRDILGKLVDDLLEPDMNGEFKNIFRQYNKDWLPDLVYANPGLVEQSYIDGKWLLYLL